MLKCSICRQSTGERGSKWQQYLNLSRWTKSWSDPKREFCRPNLTATSHYTMVQDNYKSWSELDCKHAGPTTCQQEIFALWAKWWQHCKTIETLEVWNSGFTLQNPSEISDTRVRKHQQMVPWSLLIIHHHIYIKSRNTKIKNIYIWKKSIANVKLINAFYTVVLLSIFEQYSIYLSIHIHANPIDF